MASRARKVFGTFEKRAPGYMWVKLVVGSLFCSERFFFGFSGFPLSPINQHFQTPIRSDAGPP